MGPPPPSPTPGGAAGGTEAPRLPPLTRGLTFSRCVVSTVVPSVTGPASAFFRLSFTSTMLSSRSTRLLSSTRHSSSISFSLCSRLARAPLSGGGGDSAGCRQRRPSWVWTTALAPPHSELGPALAFCKGWYTLWGKRVLPSPEGMGLRYKTFWKVLQGSQWF